MKKSVLVMVFLLSQVLAQMVFAKSGLCTGGNCGFDVTVQQGTVTIAPYSGSYPDAVIKILTPEFGIFEANKVCNVVANGGFCFFSVYPGHYFSFDLTGPDKTGPFKVDFLICQKIDQPSTCQVYRREISILRVSRYAYIANQYQQSITRCVVNNLHNGDFENCVSTFNPMAFLLNRSITLNPAKNKLYVSAQGYDRLAKCDIGTDGMLFNCTISPFAGPTQPYGVAFNPAGTIGYVTHNFAAVDRVSVCHVDANGDFSHCMLSAERFTIPTGIYINKMGQSAYVVNETANSVKKCNIGLTGDLTDCVYTGNGFTLPFGITFNSTETRAYVVNWIPSHDVSRCDVDGNGLLVNCVHTGTGFTDPRFIAIGPDDKYAYVTNLTANMVTKCEINGAGDLVNCVYTGSNLFGPTGIVIK